MFVRQTLKTSIEAPSNTTLTKFLLTGTTYAVVPSGGLGAGWYWSIAAQLPRDPVPTNNGGNSCF